MGALAFVLVALLVILFVVGIKQADEDSGVVILFCSIGLLVFGLLFVVIMSEEMYKEGQIDVLTGKIKYELIENTNKTKEWKEIGK